MCSSLLDAATKHDGIKSNEAKVYLNSFLAHVPDGVDILLNYVDTYYEDIKNRLAV